MAQPTSKLNKKLYTDITRLKLLTKPDAEVRFVLLTSPFTGDDDDEELAAARRDEYLITGKIFPNSDIYRERSYAIEMKLTRTFPADPPEVRFLTPIYHPNVGTDGKFCNELLHKNMKWLPSTSLIEVIRAVVQHIDQPDLLHATSPELGQLYTDNRAEFNRQATEHVQLHGLPRS